MKLTREAPKIINVINYGSHDTSDGGTVEIEQGSRGVDVRLTVDGWYFSAKGLRELSTELQKVAAALEEEQ